jgi:phosphoketolase
MDMPPLVNDASMRDPVLDVMHLMRRHDDAHPRVCHEAAQYLRDLPSALDVHAREWLIEQQQLRPVEQDAGKLEPLLHAGGVLLDLQVSVLHHAHKLQRLPDAGFVNTRV